MEVPTRIEADSTSLTVTWEGGRRDVIAAATLRAACPCAACGEPGGAARRDRVLGGLLAVTIGKVSLVGDYAISVAFGPDDHRTGIFPFTLLSSLGVEPE